MHKCLFKVIDREFRNSERKFIMNKSEIDTRAKSLDHCNPVSIIPPPPPPPKKQRLKQQIPPPPPPSPKKTWSNTLKQFVGCCRRIVSVYLTILWAWCLKVNIFIQTKNNAYSMYINHWVKR